jgi:DNA-binding response OmpR family regulator
MLRRNSSTKPFRIVVLTDLREVGIISEAYQMGADSFLVKPILCEDLALLIGADDRVVIERNEDGYCVREQPGDEAPVVRTADTI